MKTKYFRITPSALSYLEQRGYRAFVVVTPGTIMGNRIDVPDEVYMIDTPDG